MNMLHLQIMIFFSFTTPSKIQISVSFFRDFELLCGILFGVEIKPSDRSGLGERMIRRSHYSTFLFCLEKM